MDTPPKRVPHCHAQSGTLPVALCASSSSLAYLGISSNRFTGGIKWLANCNKLTFLDASVRALARAWRLGMWPQPRTSNAHTVIHR